MTAKASILCVDDERINLQLFEYSFNQQYEVITVDSAQKALEILETKDFDIIVSDQRMPSMTGLELFSITKEKYPDISRVLLTAFVEKETILESINMGEIFSYVTKPWKKTELQDIISKGIETTKLRKKNKDLLENLKETNVELENHKKNLEKLVHERTKKLEETNHELQKEIEERKKAELIIQDQLVQNIKQRDLIAQQQRDIVDDMEYARRIQNALLPSTKTLKKSFDEFFIINLPKNIVGGDFYWLRNKNEETLIAVADCTGHGISGAFMQMMGYMTLEAILNECNCINTADVLNELRKRIIHSLNQTNTVADVADGMDIALCMINFEKYTMQYSGAMSPISIIRNKEIIVVKAEKMPIGIHVNANINFTYQTIELKPDDMIYFYSDGYSDQFGGEKEKKLKSAVFRKILANIAHESVEKQKQALLDLHYKWKGSNDQTDDILVMGIRIQ